MGIPGPKYCLLEACPSVVGKIFYRLVKLLFEV